MKREEYTMIEQEWKRYLRADKKMIQSSSMSLVMPGETILVVGTDIPSLASAVEIDTKLSRKLPLCSFWGSECDFGIPPCAGSL